MKKLNLLYALAFIVALVSCKDDEKPAYKKADFLGSWTMTSSTVEQDDCTTYSEEIEITDATITSTSTCDGQDSSIEFAYTFDNKETVSFEIFGIEGKLVIKQLTSSTLKVDVFYEGVKGGETTYTKQ
jgi:hypothetical protein